MKDETEDDDGERKAERVVPPPTTRIRTITEAEDSGATAYLVLIAHPDNEQLGTRYALPPGGVLEIGRSASCDIRFPSITSISRNHARLTFETGVWIEDLQSTNGTRVNDVPVSEPLKLSSGDRIQTGTLHFKLLHDRDVEHAYHVAVYELMTRDGLTQLYNRRRFDEDAEKEFGRASRHGRPLSLVLFDIDHFKNVNHYCPVKSRTESIGCDEGRDFRCFARS
jgi:pSer/pThr/pTyr-binding forkhead associated (FHA) protein